MKIRLTILFFTLINCLPVPLMQAQDQSGLISFNFYGTEVSFPFHQEQFVDFQEPLSTESITTFNERMEHAGYEPVLSALRDYKNKFNPDDWLFYQLIRKTAQQLSPKEDNYHRYTLYKWFFLTRTGYDAALAFAGDKILFYVRSGENIYNIPFRMRNGKQYVCLNYHDYGTIDFKSTYFTDINIKVENAGREFTYRITRLSGFEPASYSEKELSFNYQQQDYHFRLKINPEIKTIFKNYPVVDYEYYFNIPLSHQTYSSLIPELRNNLQSMTVKNGVDYLMRFTRQAFPYKPDAVQFGSEKRLTPEQTLLYEQSDCDDRAALFFYLVREIYNLPMIVLVFPEHVTVAVKFDKPVGETVEFNGAKYSVCEPTPQQKDLRLGEWAPGLRNAPYQVAYAYHPY